MLFSVMFYSKSGFKVSSYGNESDFDDLSFCGEKGKLFIRKTCYQDLEKELLKSLRSEFISSFYCWRWTVLCTRITLTTLISHAVARISVSKLLGFT